MAWWLDGWMVVYGCMAGLLANPETRRVECAHFHWTNWFQFVYTATATAKSMQIHSTRRRSGTRATTCWWTTVSQACRSKRCMITRALKVMSSHSSKVCRSPPYDNLQRSPLTARSTLLLFQVMFSRSSKMKTNKAGARDAWMGASDCIRPTMWRPRKRA